MLVAIFLIAACSTITISYHVTCYLSWVMNYDSYIPKITFNQFRQMYILVPNKWELDCGKLFYIDPYTSTSGREYKIRNEVAFNSYRDYKKFCKFIKVAEENRINFERMKKEADLAKHFQEDINNYRKKNDEFIKNELSKISANSGDAFTLVWGTGDNGVLIGEIDEGRRCV